MKTSYIYRIFKRIFDPVFCYNKNHYGAKIISIDPELSICTKCGKKVKNEYKSK